MLFFAPNIETSPVLPEEESGHALRVLRLKEGDEVSITDGKGFFYRAVIVGTHPKRCEVDIIEKQPYTLLRPFQIHIAIAPTKQIDRMEWFAEKAMEIGIDAITFLHCRYSERRELNTARFEKILISAMKQSQQALLPKLTGMTAFQDFINRPFQGAKFIAHCEEGAKSFLKQIYPAGQNALILIGPEGDFSTEEISLAIAQGFQPITLGQNRLRTETAALVALQSIHVINN
jgi:16S rRNA (uracil1498-N3)-methyltransferase